MNIKKYRVITKDGKTYPQPFDTAKEALKTIGASNIQKIEEKMYEADVSEVLIDKKNVIVIARKNNKEVEVSDATGYSAVYNRPVLTKVFEGMTILELGEDTVLESKLHAIGTFDNQLHKKCNVDLSEGREYQYVLYHLSGNKLSIKQANAKYKDLENLTTREGMITYLSKK